MNEGRTRRSGGRLLTGAAAVVMAVVLCSPSAVGGLSVVRTSKESAPPADLFVSLAGSDSASCDKGHPCLSFQRAYRLARPGQVVEVAAGTYTGQRLVFDPTKTSSDDVVFRPAPGATVTFPRKDSFNTGTNFVQGANHFELRDFTIPDLGVFRSQDVTLRNIDGGILNITSSQNVTVQGGDYGPWTDGVSQVKTCNGSPRDCGDPNLPSANIVIDGARFHDYLLSPEAVAAGKHSECMQTDGRVDNFVVRNTTWQNCTDFDLFIDAVHNGLLIENNFFDQPMPGDNATLVCAPKCPRSGDSLRVENRNPTRDVTIRYNTALGGVTVDADPPGAPANTVLIGNIGEKGGCQTGEMFANNIWSDTTCGPGDRKADLPSLFVDGDPSDGSMNLHLRAGAIAIDHGDAANYPKTDFDRQPRPTRWPPDVGADQRESVAIALGRSIGAVRMGMPEADVVAYYGRPARTTKGRAGPQKRRVSTATYRVHGGRLDVTYDGGTVVGIATTSPYYSTATGLGPRAKLNSMPARFRWEDCLHVYRRYVGDVANYVRPLGGRKAASTTTAVSVLRKAFEKC